MEGMNYTLLRTVVRPGETLFLYTDGVNEAMNAEGDVYSNEAMFRALASSPSREPASVLRHMLDDVSVHVNGNTASDDMTILCVRYFGESADGPSPLVMEESKLARTISLFIR